MPALWIVGVSAEILSTLFGAASKQLLRYAHKEASKARPGSAASARPKADTPVPPSEKQSFVDGTSGSCWEDFTVDGGLLLGGGLSPPPNRSPPSTVKFRHASSAAKQRGHYLRRRAEGPIRSMMRGGTSPPYPPWCARSRTKTFKKCFGVSPAAVFGVARRSVP